MEGLLARAASLALRRPRVIIGAWLALLAGGAWFAVHQTDHLSSGGWEVPQSQSARAAELLARFDLAGATLGVVVAGRSPEAVFARVAAVQLHAATMSQVDAAPPLRFRGGRVVLVPLVHRGPTTAAVDAAADLRRSLVHDGTATSTRVVGAPAVWSDYQDVSRRQLAHAEALGFPLVLIILIAGFGTVVAALAPLALGVTTVVLGGAVIYHLSTVVQISFFVSSVASMIGIGVAVDYSLFIVSRFRSELTAGRTTDAALRAALTSSGGAVVFSGITVVLSLGGLLLVELNAVRSVAIGAAIVVAIAVVGAVTLLPALLALAGTRLQRLRVRLPWRQGEEGTERLWRTWIAATSAHPTTALVVAGGLMVLLASPVTSIETANRYLEQLPRDSEVRAATESIQRLAGAGFLAPVHLIVSDRSTAQALRRAALRVEGVAGVRPVQAARDGSLHLVDVVLDHDPDLAPARAALHRVESVAADIAGPDGDLVVGGPTRLGAEVQDAVVGGVWKMIAFILAVSYVVLLVVLRSVVLPLKAVAINLLSVGAAYGVLVAVFQWGWLDWTGYGSPGHVDTIVLALVLAVTFGLSMDYEVFLLTRIRERYMAGRSNAAAVREGLTMSARTITSAAMIMVAVFGAFVAAGATSLKQLGVGLAVAVFLDATLVRLVIVPAAMQLLGDWNWWLPGPLARALPTSRPAGASSAHGTGA